MSSNDFKIFSEDNDIKDFWNKAMKNIVIGFMMTTITFSFLGLQYILPTIGAALLYIGFRDLRNENKALKVAWIFSIINIIFNIASFIIISTPLNIMFDQNIVIILILIAFRLSFLIIFRKGINDIFSKANLDKKTDPILSLICWYIIIVLSISLQFGQALIVFIPITIYYLSIYKSVYDLSNDLENVNYVKTSIKISSNKFILAYSISCIFVVSICCTAFNHLKIEAKEITKIESAEIRNMLISKGFPENVLNDIADEDINILKDIVNIEKSSEELNFSEKHNLWATSVFIEMKDKKMYAIEHFLWRKGGSYWRDNFTISSSVDLNFINGRLIYNYKDKTYTSSIPEIESKVPNIDMFGNVNQNNMIAGSINYPFSSSEQRGYVFYELNTSEDTVLGSNLLNYTHYNNPFRIPYRESEYQNLMFDDKLKQHYTNFRIKEFINDINY